MIYMKQLTVAEMNVVAGGNWDTKMGKLEVVSGAFGILSAVFLIGRSVATLMGAATAVVAAVATEGAVSIIASTVLSSAISFGMAGLFIVDGLHRINDQGDAA